MLFDNAREQGVTAGGCCNSPHLPRNGPSRRLKLGYDASLVRPAVAHPGANVFYVGDVGYRNDGFANLTLGPCRSGRGWYPLLRGGTARQVERTFSE